MNNRLVCLCNYVTEKEILHALKKGAITTADIQNHTKAGTSCGKCLPEIDSIVEEFQKNKPEEKQTRLYFK